MGKKLSPQKNPPPTPLPDTSSLALVASTVQSAQCPPGGEQGRVAPLTAVVKTKRSKMYRGSSSGNTVLWRREGSSTEPLYCCTPHSQVSNSCALGYLCAHALNSHKAEPHPDSGQAAWGDRAPQACVRAVMSNCLKIKHHLLHATISFQLSTSYYYEATTHFFRRVSGFWGGSIWHIPLDYIPLEGWMLMQAVSAASPLCKHSASSGFSPYFSAEAGDCTGVLEKAYVVMEADPAFTFCSVLWASGQ